MKSQHKRDYFIDNTYTTYSLFGPLNTKDENFLKVTELKPRNEFIVGIKTKYDNYVPILIVNNIFYWGIGYWREITYVCAISYNIILIR